MKNQPETPILVFGEALIDEFPEQKIIGGAPFNVARTLAHFACVPLLITRIGDDENGTSIRNAMRAGGLSQSGLQIDLQHPTGRVAVLQEDEKDPKAHRFNILANQAYDYIDTTLASQAATNFSLSIQQRAATSGRLKGIIYFGTLAQRHDESRRALQTLLNTLNADLYLKYLDLNLRDGQVSSQIIENALRQADIVKLNEDELMYLTQSSLSNTAKMKIPAIDLNAKRESWRPAIAELMHDFKVQAMIVTLGARGYAYFDTSGEFFSSEEVSRQVSIVDTVGAGDAFSAVFLAGLVKGWRLETCLRRARDFATAVCEIRGAISTDQEFYRHWLRRWDAE